MLYRLDVQIEDDWEYSELVEAESVKEAKDLFTMRVASMILVSSKREEFLMNFSKSYQITRLVSDFFRMKRC